MSEHNSKGRVIIVSGPSGVGKSTICKLAMERLKNAYLSVSATTRQQTEKEVDGQDYWFISKEDFQQRIAKGMMLEYAEIFGNLYGTPKDKVDEALAAGKAVILEIDVQGAKQAKMVYTDAVMVFILPPSQKELATRMDLRGREDQTAAARRLAQAGTEIAAAWQYYDNMVINDDLDQAVSEVVQIIESSVGETDD